MLPAFGSAAGHANLTLVDWLIDWVIGCSIDVSSMGALPRALVRGCRVMVIREDPKVSAASPSGQTNVHVGARLGAGATYDVGTLIRAPCGQGRALVALDVGTEAEGAGMWFARSVFF